MKQQVNLLTEDIRPARQHLTFRQLGGMWAAFVVVLLSYSGWQALDLWRLDQARADAGSQLELLRAANVKLSAVAPPVVDPELEREVTALRELHYARQRVMALVENYQDEQVTGFSGYLDDLADHRVSGMWLSTISFKSGGQWIQLKGVATHPDNVPAFLQQLSAGDSFDGHRFDAFELKEIDTGLLEFDIGGPEKPG